MIARGSIGRAIFMIVLPTVVLLGGVEVLSRVTGHREVEARAQTAPSPCDRKPLDQRFGYDVGAVARYWGALDGVTGMERRFLEVDLAFPLFYGSALAAALLMAWKALGRPFRAAWLLAPVALAMLADWSENLVQLAQLARFERGGAAALQTGWIRVASAATSLKWIGLGTTSALLLTLVAITLVRAARPARGK